MEMKYIIRQIIRGCRTVPGYGSHPGTPEVIVIFGLAIFIAIMNGRLDWGIFVPILVFSVVFLPLYLHGAYTRSCLSDKDVFKKLST